MRSYKTKAEAERAGLHAAKSMIDSFTLAFRESSRICQGESKAMGSVIGKPEAAPGKGYTGSQNRAEETEGDYSAWLEYLQNCH